MTRWSESLPAELVLSQAEIGVIVADRTGNVVFSNEYVAKMLRLDGAADTAPRQAARRTRAASRQESPAGSTRSPGRCSAGSPGKTRSPGTGATAASCSSGNSRCRSAAASGEIDGIVLLITEAGRRDTQREPDRLRLLERIGQRLAGSLELDATLRAGRPDPRPSVRRPLLHRPLQRRQADQAGRGARGGWEPQPGTWARVGEAIQYPPGHFTQQAMARIETIVVPDTQAAITRHRASSPCRPPIRSGSPRSWRHRCTRGASCSAHLAGPVQDHRPA